MAATDDGEGASRERDQRIVDLALQAVYKGTGKGKSGVLEMVRVGMKRSTKMANVAKMEAVKGSGKKGSKGQESGGKGGTRACWTCGKAGHIAAWCRKGGNKNCTPLMKMTVRTLKK